MQHPLEEARVSPRRAGVFLAQLLRVTMDEAVAAHLARFAELAIAPTRFVRVRQASAGDPIAIASRTASAARALGFVALRASVAVSRPTSVDHHHVVLFLIDDTDADALPVVLRRAARASPRAHLVVDLRPPPSIGIRRSISAIARVRERAPVYEPSGGETKPDARFERALGFLERGRGAAGERWLRAAIESARRRQDEIAETRAACLLIEELASRDDWRGAKRVGVDLFDKVRTHPARLAIGAALAHVLVTMGELARAGSVLAEMIAITGAQDVALPRMVRVLRAELAFWQGRFEEACGALPAAPAMGVAEAVIAGLIAWAVGDRARLDCTLADLATLRAGDERSRVWQAALGALRDAACHPPLALAHVEPAESHSWPRLARACLAEAYIAAGRRSDALAVLGPAPEVRSEALLEEALLDRLRAAAGDDPRGGTPTMKCLMERESARGLERWGMRRTGVHLLHAVPALLQVVHDAEDELAALEGGCRWIRAHVDATAAGLVAHDEGPRLIAADGFVDRDLSDEVVREAIAAPAGRAVARAAIVVVSSPVRAQGTTIGLAIVRGRSEAASSLAEGAALLASLCAPAMRGRLDALALSGAGRSLAPDILGDSPAIVAVREAIAKAAGTTFPVLIEGESGTGKELAARALHRLSARRSRRLGAVNCAALSDELVEAELFGYARGAFTGAVGPRAGLFEEAHGSTLLLDEVSELSARAQAKLLRALQEREIRRLGENVPRPVDVRVLAATNRPLEDEVGHARFREDLLFRLAVVRIRLPALRERVEDVPRIAQAYWRRMLAEVGKHAVLGADAMAALCRHTWPGNVRELQNVIAGLALAAPARGRATARHVAQVLGTRGGLAEPHVVSLDTARRTFERQLVAAALARHSGRRSAAAHELGLTRQGLAKAMKRLGVEVYVDRAGVA